MPANRHPSLRQRLRRGADRFEFSALIDGVSTLDDPPAPPRPQEEAEREAVSWNEDLAGAEEVDAPAPREALSLATTPIAAPEAPPSEAAHPSALAPEPLNTQRPREPRLQAALEALSGRLRHEVGAMRVALEGYDAEEAGFRLAHVNQVLELLHTLDPRGDLSRQMEVAGAPPEGRAWPDTAWSFAEFAESPLSALLPPGADEAFVRSVLYAAWGVAFEPNE